MKFAIHVQGPPHASQAAQSALGFIRAALSQGHQVPRVFFSNLAVLNGSGLAVSPQDESDLHQAWQNLAQQHQVELLVCVSAALRQGLLDAKEAQRYEKEHHNLSDCFAISGLGQLTEAAVECDRLVSFGS